jgi:hypothetical protein
MAQNQKPGLTPSVPVLRRRTLCLPLQPDSASSHAGFSAVSGAQFALAAAANFSTRSSSSAITRALHRGHNPARDLIHMGEASGVGGRTACVAQIEAAP